MANRERLIVGLVLVGGLMVGGCGPALQKGIEEAIEHGDVAKVKSILAEDPEQVNARGTSGYTPLHYAAPLGKKEIVQLLIANGAKVNLKNKSYGRTPLHETALFGRKDVVELLIANGADVNAKDDDGKTPLWFAANAAWKTAQASGRGQNNSDVAKTLINNGADVNISNIHGTTILHNVASRGWYEVAELMIEKGANVNAKNKDGWTPLHYALNDGHKQVADLLRKHGAKE
jgi:ankyrin repeat protein